MLRPATVSLALLCATLLGCGDPPAHPPPAPGLDGSVGPCVPFCVPPPTDGGPVDLSVGFDGGHADASLDSGLGGFCAAFPRTGSSLTRPSGFLPTQVTARWDRESCARPELVVGLTEGGCGLTDGERLEVRFAAASVAEGSITVGVNVLYADLSSPLSLVYVRTDAPSVTVGPCGVGTVVIDQLSLVRGGRFSATFDVTLDDCDVFGDSGISLVGAVDVPVVESASDACP